MSKDRIPEEGKIEVVEILNLFHALFNTKPFQATISENLEGAEGLTQIIANNPPNQNSQLYLIEHFGHFILLKLQQIENQIYYDIFDSLSHSPFGELRKNRIAEILSTHFPDSKITKQNQYIQIAQGDANGGVFEDGSTDADNCGLSALAAHLIFEHFGTIFPTQCFVENHNLYYQLNNILLKFRNNLQTYDVINIKNELLNLATKITGEQNLSEENLDSISITSLQNEITQFSFKEDDVNQRWIDFVRCHQGRSRESESEEFDFIQFQQNTVLFAEILKDVYLNFQNLNQELLIDIFEYYKYIFEEYIRFQDKIFKTLNEETDKAANNQGHDLKKMEEVIFLTTNIINICIIFYEFYKILNEEQKKQGQKFLPAQEYDPIILMSDIAMKFCDIGCDKLFFPFAGLESVLEKSIALTKENEEIYLQSQNSAHQELLNHLNNNLIFLKLLNFRKYTPQMAAYYAKNISSIPNSHNAQGLLMDYALNGNIESATRAKKAFVNFDKDSLVRNLEVTTETLISGYGEIYDNEDEKKRLDKAIFSILNGKQFDSAIAKSTKLKIAKNYFALHVAEASEKSKVEIDGDFILKVEAEKMEEPFASFGFICKIGLKLHDESKRTLKNYLERKDFSELDKLYNLHYFRDAFVYDNSYQQHLSQKSLDSSIELYDIFLKQNPPQDLRLAALSSKFKLYVLIGKISDSLNSLREIVEIVKNYPIVAGKIKITDALKLIKQIEEEKDITTEKKLKLFNDAGFSFGELEIETSTQNELLTSFNQRLRDNKTRKLDEMRQNEAEKKRQDARIRIRINNEELFLDQLHSFECNNATYYIHVDEETLVSSGNLQDQFLAAAKSDRFARQKGENGIKFIENDIYELKINGDSRILGKLCKINGKNENKINLIIFSKFVDKAHIGGKNSTGANYQAAQNSLKNNPPKVEYIEPKTSPQNSEASAFLNDKSKKR
jgi:hypothetical protein